MFIETMDNQMFIETMDNQMIMETMNNQIFIETMDNQMIIETMDNQMFIETMDNQMIIETMDNQMFIETMDNQMIIETMDNQMFIETMDNQMIIETMDNQMVIETMDNQMIMETMDNQMIMETMDNQMFIETMDNQMIMETMNNQMFIETMDNQMFIETMDNQMVMETIDNQMFIETMDNQMVMETMDNQMFIETMDNQMFIETMDNRMVMETMDNQMFIETMDNQMIMETMNNQMFIETMDNQMIIETMDNQMFIETMDNQMIIETMDNQMFIETMDNQMIIETMDNQMFMETMDNQMIIETMDNQMIMETMDNQMTMNYERAVCVCFYGDVEFPTQRFARKASSASSLRLSPPRRQKSKVASASSPSSPIRHSHSVGSDFKSEDGCEHAQGLTVISTSKGTRQQTTSPANPGAQNGGGTHRSQSPPYTYAVIQRRRPQAADDSCVTVVSASNSNNPAFRRSFPSGHVATPSMASVVSSMMSSVKGGQGVATSLPMAASVADKDKSGASSSSNSSVKNASGPPSVTATPTKTTSSSLKLADPQMRPSSAISDLANQKSSSPKHVQISDIVSVNITGTSILNTPTVIHPCADKPNGILKRDNSVRNERTQQIQISSFAGSEDATLPLRRAASPPALPEESPDSRPPKATLRVDTSLAAPQSRSTSSSESPEWPSPPEPLTPQTPQTPNATSQMSFDSDTIQKMLRSLPSSPIDKDYSNDLDLGFHEELNISDDGQLQPQDSNGRRGSRLSRTKSLTVHDRNTKTSSNPRRQQSMDTPGQPVSYQRSEGQKPRMFNKIALEKELKMRNKNIAANYPDSGIGMAGDSGASLRSEGNSAFVKTVGIDNISLTYYHICQRQRDMVMEGGRVEAV
nr:protein still life; isoform SIF type 1-like isoform X3 [Biomphalaria glabrata]